MDVIAAQGIISSSVIVLVLVLVGVLIVNNLRRSNGRQNLRRQGKRVVAYVQEIKYWTTSSYNHQREQWESDDNYQVIATTNDAQTATKMTYLSRIWGSSPPIRVGDPVIIFVDPLNPGNYLMDLTK